MMAPNGIVNGRNFSENEQFHARLAYELGRFHPYTDDPLNATQTTMIEQRERFSAGTPQIVAVCPLH